MTCSKFGYLKQRKCPISKFECQSRFKFCQIQNKHSNVFPILLKYCPIGEISPNLVTLVLLYRSSRTTHFGSFQRQNLVKFWEILAKLPKTFGQSGIISPNLVTRPRTFCNKKAPRNWSPISLFHLLQRKSFGGKSEESFFRVKWLFVSLILSFARQRTLYNNQLISSFSPFLYFFCANSSLVFF